MSAKTKENDRHVIWSNVNLDLDDWRDELIAEHPGLSENELYIKMTEINDDYLADERINLNIQLKKPILVIGDIGRWNGRVIGYKLIDSGNISDCFYTDTDMTEFYIDKLGDLRADAFHHDGTNYYLYRAFKDNVTDTQIEKLLNKIYCSTVTRSDITGVTRRLGDDIAKVYGFNIPASKTKAVPEGVR